MTTEDPNPQPPMHNTRFTLRALTFVVIASAAWPARSGAQSEPALRAALEGKTVTVKVDMPGTSRGIDVYPEDAMPVNWREMADRIKDNATALRIGQTVMITKVVVKKDSHIEIQLGGGGFGTFGDNTGSTVSVTDATESKWERQLRDSMKTAGTSAKKKQFERDLQNARTARERENARVQAEAAQANAAREANLRVKREEGGSRFNVRYRHSIPAQALTPDGVMRALAQYVDFSGGAMQSTAPTGAPLPVYNPNAVPGANALASIRKGLLVTDVEALLGPANTATESKEGTLTLVKRNYVYDGKKITASFVNGVLIDYTIAPQ